MVERAYHERCVARARRSFRDSAHLAKGPHAATVADILDLEQDTIRIIKDKLGGILGICNLWSLGSGGSQLSVCGR